MASAVQDASGERARATKLRGVWTHNLKGIDVEIAHGLLTVVTGLSGSGKSSLAFDTLFAEGQRRYTESLSTYARQFIQQLGRPPVDRVSDIQPAIALRQHNDVQNARSTVGTVTEIDDYLQLLWAHAGVPHCVECGREVARDSVSGAVGRLLELEEGTRIAIVSTVDAAEPGARPALLGQLVAEGHRRMYIEGRAADVDVGDEDIDAVLALDTFPVLIDRVAVRPAESMRMAEAIEAGFALGRGRVDVFSYGEEERLARFDRAFRCSHCGADAIEPQPALFSFNSSLGACPTCSGFGRTIGIDFKKVIPNPAKSLREGAVAPFESAKYARHKEVLLRACEGAGISTSAPFKKLSRQAQRFIKSGGRGYKGLRGFFDEMAGKQYKMHVRIFLARYRGYDECPDCHGARLGPHARGVTLFGQMISDFWEMRIEESIAALSSWEWDEEARRGVEVVLDELEARLGYLNAIGLGYLTLGRQSRTLSGGESQRIHLSTSLGRALTDTLYVLDEPTAGMHAADSRRLIEVLYRLRDLGNTVVVVEHDPEVIEAADRVIEIGPGSGERGGELIFSGPIDEFLASETLTARALKARKGAAASASAGGAIERGGVRIVGARENNLDDIEVTLPYDQLIAVSGVSGSGKSTLIDTTLYNGWRRLQGQGGVEAGAVEAIEGLDRFGEVVMMTQSSLGRSTRSNALTYTKAYDDLRKIMASTDAAKKAGVTMSDFSFNTPGGRCEKCQGAGVIAIDMHFMADVEIVCPVCEGKRFTPKVLSIRYRGRNIDQILAMTIEEAREEFAHHRAISRKLKPLVEVGLGYVRLGQSTATLSGGEAQRLKLATYIAQGSASRDRSAKPVLFLFDEPTVGLHMEDVDRLVGALRRLVELGHTVVAIEHNIEFIAACDYVIDLGPGAGPRGGTIVAAGAPAQISQVEKSVTGRFLRAEA